MQKIKRILAINTLVVFGLAWTAWIVYRLVIEPLVNAYNSYGVVGVLIGLVVLFLIAMTFYLFIKLFIWCINNI